MNARASVQRTSRRVEKKKKNPNPNANDEARIRTRGTKPLWDASRAAGAYRRYGNGIVTLLLRRRAVKPFCCQRGLTASVSYCHRHASCHASPPSFMDTTTTPPYKLTSVYDSLMPPVIKSLK